MVTNQQPNNSQGYKLLLTEKTNNKVSSYAEVLKRRYPKLLVPTEKLDSTKGKKLQSNANRAVQFSRTVMESTIQKDTLTMGLPSKKNMKPSTTEYSTGEDTTSNRIQRTEQDIPSDSTGILSITKVDGNNQDTAAATGIQNGSEAQMLRSDKHSIQEIEKKLEERMKVMEQEHKNAIQIMEEKLEKTIEDIMDKRLRVMSQIVAESVTKKMMNTIEKCFTKFENKDIGERVPEASNIVTQPSPNKEFTNETSKGFKEVKRQTIIQSTSTDKMLLALDEIDTSTKTTSDSPHDNNLESPREGS